MSEKSTLEIRKKLTAIAKSQVGVREVPKNSNTGPDVLKYQRATWLDGTGWAWCAAFIDWCIKEWGKDGDILNALGKLPSSFETWRPKTAGAWDLENWAEQNKVRLYEGKELKNLVLHTGDIVIYKFSHVGIIHDDEGDKIFTVEGNTSPSGSREGGGVYSLTRSRSEIRSIIRILE